MKYCIGLFVLVSLVMTPAEPLEKKNEAAAGHYDSYGAGHGGGFGHNFHAGNGWGRGDYGYGYGNHNDYVDVKSSICSLHASYYLAYMDEW
eukprot:CAMPEP_0114649380 /NCGR_PEP_ID=MMETSP0191-20121206/7009_1 /TAXON_ID=126664 /ORGANISM="Sorites sp." /LENGTH=90 /DNA_ID=CAMNT_0001862983 /DNA_START=79 /DNA_END=348 /DNA_ORIENTATION=-